MKYSECTMGRIFTIKIEDGESLPSTLENFAEKKNIKAGLCFLLGGVRAGGKIVSGPLDGEETPVSPIVKKIAGVHETLGIGTLFPVENGEIKLHMHGAFGRNGKTVTGCIRKGISIWHVGEVILLELTGTEAKRAVDETLGFELLDI